jgi:diacylglycerol kinase (ATP)
LWWRGAVATGGQSQHELPLYAGLSVDWLWLPQRTALREEMIALPAGLVAAYLIAPTIAWLVAMIGSLLGLLAVEFLNTAIEKLSDHVSPEHHKGIGRIKDYGSAAVFSGMCLVPGIRAE